MVSHHTSKGRDVGPVRDTPVLLLRKLLYCIATHQRPSTTSPLPYRLAALCGKMQAAFERENPSKQPTQHPDEAHQATNQTALHKRPR